MPPRPVLKDSRIADLLLYGESEVEVPPERPCDKLTPADVEENNRKYEQEQKELEKYLEYVNEQIAERQRIEQELIDESFAEVWDVEGDCDYFDALYYFKKGWEAREEIE